MIYRLGQPRSVLYPGGKQLQCIAESEFQYDMTLTPWSTALRDQRRETATWRTGNRIDKYLQRNDLPRY